MGWECQDFVAHEQQNQSMSDSNNLDDFNNAIKEFIQKKNPSKKFIQKILPKKIVQKNPPKKIKKKSWKIPNNFSKIPENPFGLFFLKNLKDQKSKFL